MRGSFITTFPPLNPMNERWHLPHTPDFYVYDTDIRDVTWEEGEDPGPDRFTVRITFVHPTIPSKTLAGYTWSEIIAFTRRGIVVRKAVPDPD